MSSAYRTKQLSYEIKTIYQIGNNVYVVYKRISIYNVVLCSISIYSIHCAGAFYFVSHSYKNILFLLRYFPCCTSNQNDIIIKWFQSRQHKHFELHINISHSFMSYHLRLCSNSIERAMLNSPSSVWVQ